MTLLFTPFDSSAPNYRVSHQKSLHAPCVFSSTLNRFVNCETSPFEYGAFYHEVWRCIVFICRALGNVPLLLRCVFIDCFPPGWLTPFGFALHTSHIICRSLNRISHRLALLYWVSTQLSITWALGYSSVYIIQNQGQFQSKKWFLIYRLLWLVIKDNVLITTMQSEITSSELCSFNNRGCCLSGGCEE